MHAIPGLLVKDGAEAVWVAVTPDGTGLGVKVADGALRAGGVAIAALCARVLGGLPEAVADLMHPVLSGGGRAVGTLRAAGPLAAA
jgi:L-asparaginase II